MVLPAVVLLVLVIAFPLGYVLRNSFFRVDRFDPGSPPYFVGLRNYVELFQDSTVGVALANTFYYVFLAVCVEFLLGTIIALLLERTRRAAGWMRTLFLFPLMTAPIVAGLQWRWLLTDQFGIINNILVSVFGMARPPLWLADPDIAIYSLIMVDVWMNTPFVMLVMYSALCAVPDELLESALVDGASYRQRLQYITLPFIVPTILVVLLMRIMDAFRVFDTVFILTRGGPGVSTETISMYTYQIAFTNLDFEKAGALSLVATVILIGLSFVLARVLRRNEVV
jgi:multiple sugar transport system permease protein